MGTSRIVRLKGKFYDMGTPNTSFRVVAKTLKKAGIKNWYFMLEIKDYSLTNIDPHAVDKSGHSSLTADQVQRVITECTRNPWYFLREVVRINGAGGTIPYKANRGNIAQAWCFLNHIDSWLCLPRQQGKTISALAVMLWAYIFGCVNSSFMFINKDSKNAKTNLQNLAKMIDVLPEYMRFTSIVSDDGKIVKAKRNATQLTHPVNGNGIDIKPKATSYEAALNIARGFSSPVIHYDEPEFTPFIDVIVENSVSTFDTASRYAIENGYCSARLFTCTPKLVSGRKYW